LEAPQAVEGTEHRLVDRPRRDPPRAVRLAVPLSDPVAGHAGDAFAGGRATVPPGDVAPLGQGRADAGVATDAKIIDRPARDVVDPLFEFVEHRGDVG